MTLHDRIMNISTACSPSGELMRTKAATLAKEADELMAEMAEALKESMEWNWMDEIEPVPDRVEFQVTDALRKYNAYKERKQ